MNAEPPRLVTARRNDSPATAASYNKRFAFQLRIAFALNSNKKGIKIQM